MAKINVTSEINPLKKVLVHRPGNELINLTPTSLDELLFDDIPDLEVAKEEHDRFTQILRDNGAEVLYLEDLMAETLDANPALKEVFLDQYLEEADIKDEEVYKRSRDILLEIENNKDFVEKTMSGVSLSEIGLFDGKNLDSMGSGRSYLAINPMPNLYFTRDPFSSVGNGVVINRMYSETRRRETIYADYIFKYHPDYKDEVEDFYGRKSPYHIEGGDLLNANKETLLIGISQRTEFDAIKLLAEKLFFEREDSIKTIYALNIPNHRAFMHLDTVFTQIDRDAFTYHPGIIETLEVYELRPGKNGQVQIEEHEGSLSEILGKAIGVDKVRLIPCGGGDPIAAEREQWNDGSNTLAIAPGKVIVYKRNIITNKVLREAGVEVLELDASNLTVGRGGPRCMSMPLERED